MPPRTSLPIALLALAACAAPAAHPAERARFEIAGSEHAVVRAVVYSKDDANRSFAACLWVPSAPRPDARLHEAALLLGTRRLAPSAAGSGAEPDDTLYEFQVDPATARAIADAFGVAVRERRNPGHALSCAFEVAGPVAVGSASVPVRFVLRNVGPVAIQFLDGCKYASSGRDERFRFRAWRGAEELEDVGGGPCFGGLGRHVRLEPGAEHRAELDLAQWFRLDSPGTYDVRGTFELELYPGAADFARPWEDVAGLRWDDTISAEFAVTVAD